MGLPRRPRRTATGRRTCRRRYAAIAHSRDVGKKSASRGLTGQTRSSRRVFDASPSRARSIASVPTTTNRPRKAFRTVRIADARFPHRLPSHAGHVPPVHERSLRQPLRRDASEHDGLLRAGAAQRVPGRHGVRHDGEVRADLQGPPAGAHGALRIPGRALAVVVGAVVIRVPTRGRFGATILRISARTGFRQTVLRISARTGFRQTVLRLPARGRRGFRQRRRRRPPPARAAPLATRRGAPRAAHEPASPSIPPDHRRGAGEIPGHVPRRRGVLGRGRRGGGGVQHRLQQTERRAETARAQAQATRPARRGTARVGSSFAADGGGAHAKVGRRRGRTRSAPGEPLRGLSQGARQGAPADVRGCRARRRRRRRGSLRGEHRDVADAERGGQRRTRQPARL